MNFIEEYCQSSSKSTNFANKKQRTPTYAMADMGKIIKTHLEPTENIRCA